MPAPSTSPRMKRKSSGPVILRVSLPPVPASLSRCAAVFDVMRVSLIGGGAVPRPSAAAAVTPLWESYAKTGRHPESTGRANSTPTG
jgi:hypothetical protein